MVNYTLGEDKSDWKSVTMNDFRQGLNSSERAQQMQESAKFASRLKQVNIVVGDDVTVYNTSSGTGNPYDHPQFDRTKVKSHTIFKKKKKKKRDFPF